MAGNKPPHPEEPFPMDHVQALLTEAVTSDVTDYAIFVLDPTGRVASWNAGAERLKGYRRDEIVGQHFSRFYETEAMERGWPAEELRRAAATGRVEDEGWRVRKDGSRFWASVVITAIRSEEGQPRGFLKITRDLTERRRGEESLRQSEERFRLLIERVRDYAIFMLDATGHVISWNAGAERIKGYRASEIIGHHFSRFYPQEDIDAGKPARELREALKDGRVEDEGWRLRKDGSRFWANVVITAVHDHDGTLRSFAKVTRDLTERRRMEALETAGREMTEFLAMLSHELRNPLAPIRNAVTMMGTRQITDPTVSWARDVIDRQSALLAHMVQDLLDVTRITLGKIHLRRAPTDLTVVVSRAVELTRPLVEARRHRLDVAGPDEVMQVDGDVARLTQVVGNLLTNAAKYTPDGGSISLTLARERDAAVIRVRDNGMGIRPEMISRVFEMFSQGQQGIDRKEGGLGVGLAIVRRLVQLHEGSVTARSDGPGRGSEFEIRLPLLAGVPVTAQQAPALVAAGAGQRALVVDDNHDAAQSLAMLLQLWGFEVDIAHDGVSALDTAVDRSPHLVLLDLGLPGLDGFEVVRRLRVLPVFEHTPVIAISGYGQEEDQQRASEAGFDAHLVKPVEAELLRATLERLRTG